jgi:hypothetical protein
MATDLAREGFRAAPTHNERVLEAVRLFTEGATGLNPARQATLMEAFTTSDFPDLLARGFTLQAMQLAQTLENEFEPILYDMQVNDFEQHKLVDLWSDDAFEEVAQGEEYKGGTVKTVSKLFHQARKYGRTYGLTFELRMRRAFADLANFPRFLANGAVRGQRNAVANLLLTQAGNWSGQFFDGVDNLPLTRENLKAALKTVRERKNHRGQRVGGNNLVLVYGEGLVDVVDEILNPTTEEVRRTDGDQTIVTTQNNPLSGRVSRLQSETLSDKLGNPNAWAIVKDAQSDLPSLIRTTIQGLQGLDIRVKRDQGQYTSGGEVPVEQGSFNDDTIWFRGRDIWGIDQGFKEGVYASNGGN